MEERVHEMIENWEDEGGFIPGTERENVPVRRSCFRKKVFRIAIGSPEHPYAENIGYVRAVSKENAVSRIEKLLISFGINDMVRNTDPKWGYVFVSKNKDGRAVYVTEFEHLQEKGEFIKKILARKE